MLYFGSFNPIHNGHIRLAEYVIEQGLCDMVTLVISPQSPYKSLSELAPELNRYEMAETACAASKYPEQIRPSVVEFLLPKPSYTIDTLRYLEEQMKGQMTFSILMGGDQLAGLDGWKEAEAIRRYPIYVYPRQGQAVEHLSEGMTLLEGAPLLDISATEVREKVAKGESTNGLIHPKTAWYIRQNELYKREE